MARMTIRGLSEMSVTDYIDVLAAKVITYGSWGAQVSSRKQRIRLALLREHINITARIVLVSALLTETYC